MHCLVTGCNFLLKAITHEAFRYENSTSSFVPTTGGWASSVAGGACITTLWCSDSVCVVAGRMALGKPANWRYVLGRVGTSTSSSCPPQVGGCSCLWLG
jgi:hypothetical protein